jgi:SpoIID/LytB domain protein
MWRKILDQNKIVIGAVFFLVVFFSSTAIGLLVNYDSQPPTEQVSEEEQVEVEELLTQAKEEYYQGHYTESIIQYQEIIARSNALTARENLAAIYGELGRYELARDHYQKLVDQIGDAKYKLSLAKVNYNLGHKQEAKAGFKELIELPDLASKYIYKEAYYHLALLSKEEGDYKSAKNYLEKALDYQEWALGYYQLGLVEFNQGNYQAAINYYQAALNTDGSLKGVKKDLALAHLQVEQTKQAAKYLQQAKQERADDQLVNTKIKELKEEYPDYFKDPKRPPTEDEIPEEVDFKAIEPLEKPGRDLRIGIMTNQEKIYFRVGSDFELIKQGQVIAEGAKEELAVVTIEDGTASLKLGAKEYDFSEAVKIVPKSYAPLLVHQVEYGAGYYWGGKVDLQYRGQLEIRANGGSLTAINIVPLEAYLMSVVPSEMSASWPLEALKVQSVAARSYTLANLDKHSEESYDLCSTVHCAAYRGINREHSRTNRAVQETIGEVMTYDGRPINAVYSANSGGHTENSEDVWNFAVPYLKGVSTEKEKSQFPLGPARLKEWLQEIPDSYSQDSRYTNDSHYRWQRELEVDYLESRLGIDNIEQIMPTNRGTGGSVESVLIVGAKQQKKIKSGLRYKFGGLRSNRFWIQPQYKDGELTSFVFYGGGWGHSVGMDQVAVASMADSDYDYKSILQHFYTGIEFEPSQTIN